MSSSFFVAVPTVESKTKQSKSHASHPLPGRRIAGAIFAMNVPKNPFISFACIVACNLRSRIRAPEGSMLATRFDQQQTVDRSCG